MEDPLAYPYPSFNIKEQVIHEQCRQLIANVAAFMKNEAELFKQTMQIIIPITSYKERVIAATGISEETYSKIVKDPEQVTTVISDSFPTQGVKRKHDNLEAFVKEHVNEVESVSPFHIKEEIMAPEQIVEDFEIETVPIAEPDIQIKDEVTTDLLKEEEICATSETVYVPSFQSEEALSTVNEKSRKQYGAVYKAFMDWRTLKNINSFSESTVLTYFEELTEKYKSSTLWTLYSMLRSTLNRNHSINIEKYSKLRAFLKRQSEGYRAKKTKTFTHDEIHKFMNEAPDNIYLSTKVAMIMGIMGACRSNELHSMSIKDVQDLGSAMLVTVPRTRTKSVRKFTIADHFYLICKKYVDLRPPNIAVTSFFLNYQKGKCTAQNIGINKFGSMGRQIAKFLKIPNPQMYTGRAFRRCRLEY